MADKPAFQQMQFPELIDIETLARLLGVSERYVRRMVAERRVPTVKVGHYVRFDLADVRRWVESQRRPIGSSWTIAGTAGTTSQRTAPIE